MINCLYIFGHPCIVLVKHPNWSQSFEYFDCIVRIFFKGSFNVTQENICLVKMKYCKIEVKLLQGLRGCKGAISQQVPVTDRPNWIVVQLLGRQQEERIFSACHKLFLIISGDNRLWLLLIWNNFDFFWWWSFFITLLTVVNGDCSLFGLFESGYSEMPRKG